MLRILRHLAYEAPHHLTTHQPDTDRCAPPAAPDPVTPAPPTWLAQFMSDAGRGHLPSQSHRPFIIDGGGS